MKAYRVSVQRGHTIDVRVKFKRGGGGGRKEETDTATTTTATNWRIPPSKSPPQTEEEVYKALETFDPLASFPSRASLPSLPASSIVVIREGGAPRPKSHHRGPDGQGMSVRVGNVCVSDGVWDATLTLVVDNLAKGAYGAALQLAEYVTAMKGEVGKGKGKK